ncbi:hypothetical protein BGX24_001984 [Mortierella sp. AD032]|nr:hypothetical protein BGX24_001984 [Mortierella sp. AD032]
MVPVDAPGSGKACMSHVLLSPVSSRPKSGAMFYNVTKNGIYLRKREFAVPSETIPSQVNQMSWEERIAQDEANAAKKGYKVDYRSIHETSTANAKDF